MGKFNAIIEEVKVLHAEGRPVLIGTVSIEKNEVLSRLLKKAGVPHQVLNAKNNESEAKIIMQAGQKGAVTLATNIAGRGTDIMLGEGVKEVGGLAVIGSERHESRRIDNQLRGRGGRQGDPGTSQFFVSTEDDLMRIFGGEKIQAVMGRLKIDDSMPLQNRFVSKSLEGAQKKVEGFNFDTRKNVVQYDDVMNRHRKATYIMRKQILHEADIHGRIKVFINDEARQLSRSPESITDNFEPMVKEVFPLSEKTLDKLFDSDTHKFEKSLEEAALKQYSTQETRFGAEVLRKVERDVYLQILDNLWMQHLENMEHLREGIGWVGIGQRDPLVEYRRQAQHLFETMQQDLRHDTLRTLFHAEPIEEDALDRPVETELTRAARSSVEGSDVVVEIEDNYSEEDFLGSDKAKHAATRPSLSHKKKQQSRKKERKNKAKNRRRK
jgi:preprotein translocase subunit SecA